MLPVVSIVGRSKSGKTSLLERLIPELRERGYRLAIIKHTPEGFQLDRPEKNSWRLTEAGSDAVILSSPDKFALMQRLNGDLTIEELSAFVGLDFDLILTEGFREGSALKIEVYRKELGEELICSPHELLAVVSNVQLNISTRQYSPDDIRELTDLIEKTFLSHRSKEDVTLYVNGNIVPVTPFVKEFIARTLIGMVSTLKGVEDIKKLDIRLRRG